jgi:hypothetical protein
MKNRFEAFFWGKPQWSLAQQGGTRLTHIIFGNRHLPPRYICHLLRMTTEEMAEKSFTFTSQILPIVPVKKATGL